MVILASPKTVAPFAEGEVGGDDDRGAFVEAADQWMEADQKNIQWGLLRKSFQTDTRIGRAGRLSMIEHASSIRAAAASFLSHGDGSQQGLDLHVFQPPP